MKAEDQRGAVADVLPYSKKPTSAEQLAAMQPESSDSQAAAKLPSHDGDGIQAQGELSQAKEALQSIKQAAADLVLAADKGHATGLTPVSQPLAAASHLMNTSASTKLPSVSLVEDSVQHGQEWRTNGSDWIGQRVRRTYLDSQTNLPRSVDGTVISWMGAEFTNYISEKTGKAAALWMVKYDDEAVGEEELEASEVEEALLEHGKETGISPAGGSFIATNQTSAASSEETAAASAAAQSDSSAMVADASSATATETETAEWMTTGSQHLKKRVRRKVPVIDGGDVWLDATIVGWLPAGGSSVWVLGVLIGDTSM